MAWKSSWNWENSKEALAQDICAELAANANALVVSGKGIAALDESTGTMQKRFDQVGAENTEANRNWWRATVLQTPNLSKYISGVIMTEETLNQKTPDNQKIVEWCKSQNILVGVKVDKGVWNLNGTDEEKITSGIDGLAKRCADLYSWGVRFAKWRAVFTIDKEKGKPSALCIQDNARELARYASICQQNRLVPIVEPEVLSDGNWSPEDSSKVSEHVWWAVLEELRFHNVLFEGMLLKPNMVTEGNEWKCRATPAEVAFWTLRTLRRVLPPAVPGVVFLSGGQSEEVSSLNLNAINQQAANSPWKLSFSYGRALQGSALKIWAGNNQNKEAVQTAILERAKANSEAQLGKYKGGAGGCAATDSLWEKKYVY